MQEKRTQIAPLVFGLCFRQKEKRTNRLVEIVLQIARIFGDAHHFEFTAGCGLAAEVLPKRIFILEELPRTALIDDSRLSRSRRILFGDATPLNNRGSDNLKISPRNSIPRSEVVVPRPGRGMPRNSRMESPELDGKFDSQFGHFRLFRLLRLPSRCFTKNQRLT